MLVLQRLRENSEQVIAGLAKRGIDAAGLVNKAIELDEKRRSTQGNLDQTLAEANQLNKKIGELFRSGHKDEANALREKSTALKESGKVLQSEMDQVEQELNQLLTTIPNVPHESVPAGKSAEDNEEVKRVGEIPELSENALPHWDIATQYGLIDFELGVKITGAGFPVYKGKGARIQRALINFFLDENREAGYEEFQPPLVVNEASGFGTGQLPDKEGQMYHVTEDDLYLIPTAEVPVTNFFRNEIVDELPVKCTAYTPCFRREEGSYGKDVRGLNRLHQFDKVEIVQVVHPEKSYETLEAMVNHVASILDKLELPYRILRLCGGDMGFTSALTYDFEIYSAAQKRWLEVSSVSNFETYQANRLKLRYRDEDRKTQLCHTLNGSALALPRILAGLLENHQDENGVRIPKALQSYTGFDRV